MTGQGTQQSLVALLVSDDPLVAGRAASALAEHGFRAEVQPDPDAARKEAPTADVIVVDLQIPGVDSVELCRQLRPVTSAYIVAVGERDSLLSLVLSLSVGADDFIAKPFEMAELIARLRAMLRRPRRLANTSAVLRCADLEIDTDLREARLAGRPVPLSMLEFDLLETLARNPKLTLTRRQLLDQVWGQNWMRNDHVIDVHISNLRRKLSDDAQAPRYIRTVRGFGFRMAADPQMVLVA